MNGKLYIVSTPIGNLSDITLRAIETLRSVDIIACEDTRKARILLNHYNIKNKKLIVHNNINEKKSSSGIIKLISEGKNIALITNSGTPLISDPGYILVRECIINGIEVIPIPGPSALITALTASGLPADKFLFVGFLPKKKVKVNELFRKIKDTGFTTIIFESPHRVLKTLERIQEYFGNIDIVLERELTKTYEEIMRGKVKNIIKNLDRDKKIGELIIIMQPKHRR